MKRLRILFKSRVFVVFLFLLFVCLFLIRLLIPKTSNLSFDDTEFVGRVQDFYWVDGKLQLTISCSSEILNGISISQLDFMDLHLHDLVLVQGKLKELSPNTNFHLFNYQEYAKRHNQYYSIQIESVEVIQENQNFLFFFKNFLRERIQSVSTAPYLFAFILGDTSLISEEVLESYRTNGVSHLLAVSGMHVSFLMGVLLFVLKRLHKSEVAQLIFMVLFLCFYCFLVDFSPSVLRASLFFVLLRLRSIYSWNIRPITLLGTVFLFLLAINPFYLWEVGFQYSFLISAVLTLFTSAIKRQKNYFIQLLSVSYLAFVASLPISVFHFHQVNLLSVFLNLFFVPLISLFIFPFSFLILCFPFLDGIYSFLITILESSSLFFSSFSSSWCWVMRHPGWVEIIYLCSFSCLTLLLFMKGKRVHFLIFLLCIFLYHNACYFIKEDYLVMLDVGQGDAILLYSNGECMLIDTGGSLYKDLANNTIIPYLKSLGIQKIQTLLLTHGDFDHMGESIKLVNNFKVNKVIFNNGEYNDLELELMEVLEDKDIPYYKNVEKLNLGDIQFYFLNTGLYDNENDNSNVIYFRYNNYQFLFMGDAGVEKETDILDQYNLKDIDFLKVGHHGSDTSSSEEFITRIRPKYSLISVGKNNRYNHPKDSVLDNLSSSKIYRTDQDGSIEIQFNRNGYKIRTCIQ